MLKRASNELRIYLWFNRLKSYTLFRTLIISAENCMCRCLRHVWISVKKDIQTILWISVSGKKKRQLKYSSINWSSSKSGKLCFSPKQWWKTEGKNQIFFVNTVWRGLENTSLKLHEGYYQCSCWRGSLYLMKEL